MLDVCLLGTGGMMPLPYRWLTSLMTRCDGSNLLIDCGEGTQVALKEKGWSPKPVDVICFTHYHADHISGLPGLLLTMGNAERTEPVIMIGPKGLERVVGALRTIAPELPFPLRFIELSEPREQFQIGPYVIDAYKVNHNVTCYGYSISIPRKGRFDVERARQQQIPQKYWNRLQKGETVQDGERTLTPDMVLGPARKGIRVTYCTDTRPVPVIAEYAKEADLIIYVVDSSNDLDENDYEIMKFIQGKKSILLLNKSDLERKVTKEEIKKICKEYNIENIPVIEISAKEEKGIDRLEEIVKEMFYHGEISFNNEIYITNIRHKTALERAKDSLMKVIESIENDMPEDFYSIDLMDAYETLGSITGEMVGEDLVNEIFSKFCMGQ